MSVDILSLLIISLRGTASKNVPAAPAFVGQPKLLPPVKVGHKSGVNPQVCLFQSSFGMLQFWRVKEDFSSVYLET